MTVTETETRNAVATVQARDLAGILKAAGAFASTDKLLPVLNAIQLRVKNGC